MNPVCPECGWDFEQGVQSAGEMTSFWRGWLGWNLVIVGVTVITLFLTCCVGTGLVQFLVIGDDDDNAELTVGVILFTCIPVVLMLGVAFLGSRVLKKSPLKPFIPAGASRGVETPGGSESAELSESPESTEQEGT